MKQGEHHERGQAGSGAVWRNGKLVYTPAGQQTAQEDRWAWPVRAARLVRALQYSLLELLALSPLLLLAAAFLYEGKPAAWGWLAGLIGYSLLAGAAASVRFLRWTGVLIPGCTVLIIGWTWLLYGISVPALFSLLAGIVLSVRTVNHVRHGIQAKVHTTLLWLGFACCAPVAFIIHRVEGLSAYSVGLILITAAVFVVTLAVSNTASLSNGAYGGKNATASGLSIRRFNRLLVAAFAVPVVLASIWGLMDKGINQLGRLLVRLINAILPDAEPEIPEPASTPPSNAEAPFPFERGGKAGWFWVVLDYLLIAAFILGIAVLLFYLGRGLYRRFPGWMKAFYAWLTRIRGEQEDPEAGYIDVVTSTRDSKPEKRTSPWKRLRRMWEGDGSVRWENLDSNSARIRYLYSQAVRRSIRQGLRWKPEWTPTETVLEASRVKGGGGLSQELCETYERARYGGLEPDDKETARFRSDSGK